MTDEALDRYYPDFPHLERGARRRLPKFVFEYVQGGTGLYHGVERNRTALDRILFAPRYAGPKGEPDLRTTFLGQHFDAPFGMAPLGLGGLIWPGAARMQAAVARDANVAFILSNFSTDSLETIARIGGANAWFQLYPATLEAIQRSHLERLTNSGYETLVVTVDTPTATRRPHDVKNGLSVPPRFDLRTLWQITTRPRWAFEQLRHHPLTFENLERYVPDGANLAERARFLVDIMEGRVNADDLKRLRDSWPHKLIVKGVMHPDDAASYVGVGVDALIVSNHGGRQLDSAPASSDALKRVRARVGPRMPIIADSGVRNGQDIARLLALGADFVLLGRAFAYAVAVAGEAGVKHVTGMLKAELRIVMSQMGCLQLASLPEFLVETPDHDQFHLGSMR